MFDKTIRIATTCLLAFLVGVVAWFCWTRRDASRFTLHSDADETVVFDNKTGTTYMLVSEGDAGPGMHWIEMQPQTGRAVVHRVSKASPTIRAAKAQ